MGPSQSIPESSGFLPDDFIEIENIDKVDTGKYEITFFSGCFAEDNQINHSFASKDSADNIVVMAGKVRIDKGKNHLFCDVFGNRIWFDY